jgi:hypothetical protein
VWTTQEARLILAYYRTNRQAAAAASMQTMLDRFSRQWRMDAPLPSFGTRTWANEPVMLTIDAFGCAAALVRGLFETVYAADSITLLPHVPDEVTAVAQKFGVRWGPYRIWLSSEGVRSAGIAAVTVNGTAVAAAAFNDTALVLGFAAMPAPSAAALAATGSDVSVASDPVSVHFTFKAAPVAPRASAEPATPAPAAVAPAAVAPADDADSASAAPGATEATAAAVATNTAAADVPPDYALRLRASDLLSGAHPLRPGDPVTSWLSSAPAATAASTACAACNGAGAAAFDAPELAVDAASRLASVVFPAPGTRGPAGASASGANPGVNTGLGAPLLLAAETTTFVVMRDDGSGVTPSVTSRATMASSASGTSIFNSVLHFGGSDRGLAVNVARCSGGNPGGAAPCTAADARLLSVDWVGSPDYGLRNVSGRLVVASLTYGATNATSAVDGCSEQGYGAGVCKPVKVPAAGPSETFVVGNRLNAGYGRQFRGALFELVVYNRTLGAAEHAAAVAALRAAYRLPARDCAATPAPTPGPAPPRPALDCAALRSKCNTGSWPRKCGLTAAEGARLVAFVGALETAGPAQVASLPYAMARQALDYTRGFGLRCAALNSGAVPALLSEAADEASVVSMLTTGGNLYEGLDNVLRTRYGAAGAEPLAKAIAATWAKLHS